MENFITQKAHKWGKEVEVKNYIPEVLLPITKAISELSAEGIVGVIYFYNKNECSCCYGAKNVSFTVEGNYAGNMGSYGTDIIEHRIKFSANMEEAQMMFKVFKKHLRGTGYNITWEKKETVCMFITRK